MLKGTHKPQPIDAERRIYTRCQSCGHVLQRNRVGVWVHRMTARARILAGPIWEYSTLINQSSK